MDLELVDNKWAVLSVPERRDLLMAFEEACKALEKEKGVGVPMEPVIYSADGVYAREITIPAGTALVGAIHRKAQINVISKGKIRVATEEGVRTIEAPCTFVSPAGTKRAGFVLEETVWACFLPTSKVTDKDVYAEFIAPSYEALEEQKNICHSTM